MAWCTWCQPQGPHLDAVRSTSLFRLSLPDNTCARAVNGPVYPGAAEGPPFRFNASLYYGARVVSIQGTPAWSYMMAWVRDNAGGYATMPLRYYVAMSLEHICILCDYSLLAYA